MESPDCAVPASSTDGTREDVVVEIPHELKHAAPDPRFREILRTRRAAAEDEIILPLSPVLQTVQIDRNSSRAPNSPPCCSSRLPVQKTGLSKHREFTESLLLLPKLPAHYRPAPAREPPETHFCRLQSVLQAQKIHNCSVSSSLFRSRFVPVREQQVIILRMTAGEYQLQSLSGPRNS